MHTSIRKQDSECVGTRPGSTPEQLPMESRGACTRHAFVHQKARCGVCGNPTRFRTGTASRGVTKSTPHTLVLQKARLGLWEEPDQFPHRTSCWLWSVTQSTLHTLVCQKTRGGGGGGGWGRPVCTPWTAASCGVLCGPHVLHALVQQFSRFQVCGNPAWLHTGTTSHGVTRSMRATRPRHALVHQKSKA